MACIDFGLLENELYKHGLAGFRRIRELRPADHFYCFAFFTSGDYGYVSLTASSYEGLEEVARKHKSMERYKDRPLAQLKNELKWSPADSPIHTSGGGILEPLQGLMDQVSGELMDIEVADDDWSPFDAYVERIDRAFVGALKRIESEGVFGVGSQRNEVVLNLLMGDQSDDARIEFAKRVNPRESVKMLIHDLNLVRT